MATDYSQHLREILPNPEIFLSLAGHEIPWRDRYHFLASKGYTLRPRYHPDWKPSWLENGRCMNHCEDFWVAPVSSPP